MIKMIVADQNKIDMWELFRCQCRLKLKSISNLKHQHRDKSADQVLKERVYLSKSFGSKKKLEGRCSFRKDWICQKIQSLHLNQKSTVPFKSNWSNEFVCDQPNLPIHVT